MDKREGLGEGETDGGEGKIREEKGPDRSGGSFL